MATMMSVCSIKKVKRWCGEEQCHDTRYGAVVAASPARRLMRGGGE